MSGPTLRLCVIRALAPTYARHWSLLHSEPLWDDPRILAEPRSVRDGLCKSKSHATLAVIYPSIRLLTTGNRCQIDSCRILTSISMCFFHFCEFSLMHRFNSVPGDVPALRAITLREPGPASGIDRRMDAEQSLLSLMYVWSTTDE